MFHNLLKFTLLQVAERANKPKIESPIIFLLFSPI